MFCYRNSVRSVFDLNLAMARATVIFPHTVLSRTRSFPSRSRSLDFSFIQASFIHLLVNKKLE